MARFRTLLALAATLGALSCKGTEDWLEDLKTVHDDKGRLKLDVYDAGQLSYEAFAGLAEQETLTLSQAARAIALAARIVESADQPLLRAQAIRLISRLAVRYPFPPASEPFEVDDLAKAGDVAAELIGLLDRQEKLLEIENVYLPGLKSPDRAVADFNLTKLREATGENVGATYDAWAAWWKERGAAVRSEAAEKSREPLRRMAQLRFGDAEKGGGLGSSRATLLYLGYRAALFDLPETRAETEYAITRVARQTIVHAIAYALRAEDTGLRIAAAAAARQVVDPSLAAALVYALPRERDAGARGALAEAAAYYPTRDVIAALVRQMPVVEAGGRSLADEERALGWRVARALTATTGEDFGLDGAAWALWWEKSGVSRWP